LGDGLGGSFGLLGSSKIFMPRSYAVTALATLFMISASIAMFCFVVDPYKLFPSVPRLSPDKSVDLFYFLRLHKPYAVEHIRPQRLIVGSSRSAELPPQPLQVLGGIAYNAALPGTSLSEMRLMIEHAQALNPLKIVLVGIDYPMFRKGNSDQVLFHEDNRYRKIDASVMDKLLHSYQRFQDYWRSLFSVDAIMDSWRVLFGSGRSKREYHEDGTWNIDTRVAAPAAWRYGMLAQQMYNSEISEKIDRHAFDELTELLDFADVNGIPLILLISPMQGLLMHTVYLAGTWDQYLDWQRELVTLVAARNTDTPIYGVEDNPQLVLEAIDAPQPLFEDGIHYTRKAGLGIITCLIAPCDSNLQPTRLDIDSITPYLEQVDALRQQYLQDNPTDVAKARKWLHLKPGDGT
jgi:hypothetical protein